ncbi:MAG: TIGR02646 family protein [Desulfobacteraceae bacterium]|nr:TIGR02646 family protein [Desulfobacteraceae bacterium]
MKHVVKGDEPASFQHWKQQNRPTTDWSDFSGTEVYQELKSTLIEQQGELCCYCEIALKQNTDAHVEHLKNRQNYPRKKFDFQNLLASCQHNYCCGHKKGNGYFADMVSPLNADCQSRFTYTGNGKIIPSDEDDTSAQKTIELLALNCKRLRDQRESIIKNLDDTLRTTDAIDSDYLQHWIEWYGFFTVIQYVAAKNGASI